MSTSDGKAMLHIQVNGKDESLDVDPAMPLLWVLRDVLGLTGTKYGCGQALCGACTIHLDGDAVRACVTPVARAVGRKVTTIEGLGAGPGEVANHPLQQAWCDLGVPQCGFCQPGQIMSSAALLAKRPHPSDDEIDQSLAGNLCRCGTYGRIREAVRRASSGGAK